MFNLERLNESPTMPEFRKRLKDEDTANRVSIVANQLSMNEEGIIILKGVDLPQLSPSEEALLDLAYLAKIPANYFINCDPYLRSVNFNRRIGLEIAWATPLEVLVTGSNALRIRADNLFRTSRSRLLDAVLIGTPEDVVTDELRVMTYGLNGVLDIAIVSPTRKSEPKKDDIVCYGVSLTEEKDGAVQIGIAIYRLACGNGALSRVCSDQHKIRRPKNDLSREKFFFKRIEDQTRESWKQWNEVSTGLKNLCSKPLDNSMPDRLVSRLRQSPFFISVRLANTIRERLNIESASSEPTMYDFWNAITYIASNHKNDNTGRKIPWQYSYRLRLGAGTMTRSFDRICENCHQFVLSQSV